MIDLPSTASQHDRMNMPASLCGKNAEEGEEEERPNTHQLAAFQLSKITVNPIIQQKLG